MQALSAWRIRENAGSFRHLIDILAPMYFTVVELIFWVLNIFNKKKSIPVPTNPLVLLSINELQDKLKCKEITAVSIIHAYIQRIEEVNPLINAVVHDCFNEALKKASDIDAKISNSTDTEIDEYFQQFPLLGMPFTIKDSLKVNGQPCTVGVVAYRDYIAEETGTAVQRLLDAGAILLARTNVPQCVMWLESANALFGRTRNPYDLRRNPGGSSGGQGALLAAAGSLFGVGTDIAGSIRVPCFVNGIFGIMPPPGYVPIDGMFPSFPMDTFKASTMLRCGPMTRFPGDLQLLMKVMSGKEQSKGNIDGLHLFFMDGMENCALTEPTSWEQKKSLMKAVTFLEECSKTSAVKLNLPQTEFCVPLWFASFKESAEEKTFDCWMNDPKGEEDPVSPWKELFKFFLGLSNHSLAMILTAIGDSKKPFSSGEMERLLAVREEIKDRISSLLEGRGVIIIPGMPKTADFHNELLFKQAAFSYMGFWNVLGFTALQAPTGLSKEGLPTGVQIVTTSDNLPTLYAIAEKMEEAFGGWIVPCNHHT